MWQLTAALWFFILFSDLFIVPVRVACCLVIGLLEFVDRYTKRLRLYRIERALRDIFTWWYYPFLAFNALLHVLTIFFAWISFHAMLAYNVFTFDPFQRRIHIFVGIVLGTTCYVMERLTWKAFFQRI